MSSTLRQSSRARLVVLGTAVAALVVAAVTGAPWPGSRAGAQANEPAEEVSRLPGGGGPLTPFNTDASISADGRFVVFNADPPFVPPPGQSLPEFVAIRDRIGDTTAPVPYAGVGPAYDSANPTISDDGCVIAFSANVINGEFGGYQWVVHDRCNNVSAIPAFWYSPNPFPPPAVSADGSVIAWSNGTSVYVFARSGNAWNNIATFPGGPFAGPPLFVGGGVSISDDGNLVAFTVGTGSAYSPNPSNVAVWDRTTGTTSPITTVGFSYGPSISGDGNLVAFYQYDGGANQYNVLVYDRPAAVTRLVAEGADDPDISRDGRHIAYNLDFGEIGEIFVATSTSPQPFATIATDLVSYSTAGPPNLTGGSASSPAISEHGRWVAFHSYAGDLLSDEPAFFDGWHVYVRQRRPVLAVSPINFGAVQVGTSFDLPSTVTNQGLSGFVITSITAGGGFAVVGENCPDVLHRGESCTVTVRFAPGAVGAHNGQLTVRDDTYPPAPLAYSGALAGTGSAIPVVTTIPPTVPPTVTVTTTPTVPVPLSLTIDPPTVTFDATTVGVPAATQIARVRNDGTTPNTVSSVEVSGTNAADFEIVDTNCAGAVLAPDATCDVEVEFTPGDAGDRVGQLDAVGDGGSTASAALRGSALYSPSLEALPAVASPGQVTTIIGDAFPPSSPIDVVWDLTPQVFSVTSDASGSFTLPVLIMGHTLLGPQIVSAVAQPGVFEQVDTDLLIVPGTVQPQATAGLLLFVTNHVSRG